MCYCIYNGVANNSFFMRPTIICCTKYTFMKIWNYEFSLNYKSFYIKCNVSHISVALRIDYQSKKKTIRSWPLKNFIATPLYMCLYVYSMSKLCVIDFTWYNNYYLYKYWITTEYCSVIGLFMVMCF